MVYTPAPISISETTKTMSHSRRSKTSRPWWANTRRSSRCRVTGVSRLSRRATLRSSRAMARCRWYSGHPGTSPTLQNRGPDRLVSSRSQGALGQYIDRWADAARAFGKPMIVFFANEMNGDWFPWSGSFYGGKNAGAGQPNERQGPEILRSLSACRRSRAGARRGEMWSGFFTRITIPSLTTLGISPRLLSRVRLCRLARHEHYGNRSPPKIGRRSTAYYLAL